MATLPGHFAVREPDAPVQYPTPDGRPMGETDLHPQGAGLAPGAVFLHGLGGEEKNPDTLQALSGAIPKINARLQPNTSPEWSLSRNWLEGSTRIPPCLSACLPRYTP